MRISDWSSDVCSSDLSAERFSRSELDADGPDAGAPGAGVARAWRTTGPAAGAGGVRDAHARAGAGAGTSRNGSPGVPAGRRSEEHTSELQSLMRLSYAVFCFKKNKQNTLDYHH